MQDLKNADTSDRGKTLGKLVRNELRKAIMAGRFSPGEKLTIRSVASALGVSLTPAREALYNLVAEGALSMARNGTVYVPKLDEEAIDELLKVRLALEGLAAREAASRVSDAKIAEARVIDTGIVDADAREDYASVIDLNWRFHFLIYEASGMAQLLKMIEGCWLQTGSYLNLIYPDYGRLDTGIKNHAEMVVSLEARDGERLAAAVCRDIETGVDHLRSMVRDTSTWS